MKEILIEGGAAGHLLHVVEDLDLTFSDVAEIFSLASSGKLERVTEKVDGINLVFSFNVDSSQLLAARSGGDISRGGMDAAALAKKYFGRGNIEDAFNKAFKILSGAVTALPVETQIQVFGESAQRWYSIEIIYSQTPGTIHYDSSYILFHQSPVFEIDENGKVDSIDGVEGVDALSNNIEQMQRSIEERDWIIRGPALIKLKGMADQTIAKNSIARLNEIISSVGLSMGATLREFIKQSFKQQMLDEGFTDEASEALGTRAAGIKGAPTIVQIKKLVKPTDHARLAVIGKQTPDLVKETLFPVEAVIHDFAIELLKTISSVLIANQNQEIARLKGLVNRAIAAIERSNSDEAMEILATQMKKLGSVDNIASAMEGIVFQFKGKTYKFTGAFAPAHQILSLFTFGKGSLKFQFETRMMKTLGGLLTEGGHAFSDVSPIELEDLKRVWSTLIDDLEDLGLSDVVPIGSTLKKLIAGDVDVAARSELSKGQLTKAAQEKFGVQNAKTQGSGLTISYPVGDHRVQVDVMVGDPAYLSWARGAPSAIPDSPEYSPLKGVIRNIMLSSIIKQVSRLWKPVTVGPDVRDRYTFDFDRGLMRKVERLVKGEWKADKKIEPVVISSDPEEISQMMLGVSASRIRRPEDLIDAVKTSPITHSNSSEILRNMVNSLAEALQKNPDWVGGHEKIEPTLAYLEELINR